MKVGITQREKYDSQKGYLDILEQSYIDYYQTFGLTLIPIPNNIADAHLFMKELGIESLFLSGGNDVSPALYNSKAEISSEVSTKRDTLERLLLEWAFIEKIPVFCECRGMQFLNVYLKGSLIQGIENHVGQSHNVTVNDDRFKGRLSSEVTKVNSFHNNGISKEFLANELVPFAISEDGLIEGVYHVNLPILGIMWHPERKGSDEHVDKYLVKAFFEKNFFWL